MHTRNTLTQQLRNTIGTEVDYNGMRCTIVELLEEPLCLVVQAIGARTTIQDNQFGTPSRIITPAFTIPCLSEESGEHLHPELLNLALPLD